MVTRRFTQGLAWLHARVGRQTPVELTPESDRRRTNSHAKAAATGVALLPTVYLPAVSGANSLSLLDPAA
jgi:hypothetical protein